MCDYYVTFVARWFRGNNCGDFGPLYITSRGKGTSLFLERRKKGKPADLRLGQIVGNEFRLCTVNDPLNLRALAAQFGLIVYPTTIEDYRADGSIKR
jgi:hypothetical protein